MVVDEDASVDGGFGRYSQAAHKVIKFVKEVDITQPGVQSALELVNDLAHVQLAIDHLQFWDLEYHGNILSGG